MPGAMQHVEGVVTYDVTQHGYDVAGLQDILEKFKGQKVSITVEEAD